MTTLKVVPLGGLGEFGMNMMAFSFEGTTIVVDAGVMFPEQELPGVEFVIPDLSYLEQLENGITALILTHGHEDHIGAVPYVLPLIRGPIVGTPFTLALLKSKLSEHPLSHDYNLQTIQPKEQIEVGAFKVEFLHVTHSMPGCVALAIHTSLGTLVHTGDFKLDRTPPDGNHSDLQRLAELGQKGVLALFSDSTNIDRHGFSGSETDVIEAFEEIFSATHGKIIVTIFASAIHRMQVLINLAIKFDRQVSFIGRRMNKNVIVAKNLGHLHVPSGVELKEQKIMSHPERKVLCITTGSQGEPSAALTRISVGKHRHVKLTPRDTVVFSARAIPGNEKSVDRIVNQITRLGAYVIQENTKKVHVSGHGSEEEIKFMLSLVRPRHFVPIHGEYRQLARHAQVAKNLMGDDTDVLLSENGDILEFDTNGASCGSKAPTGRILVDRTLTGKIVDEVLRDRRHLGNNGLLIPIVAINTQGQVIKNTSDIVTRGFVVNSHTENLLAEALTILNKTTNNTCSKKCTDSNLIKAKVKIELQRFFRKRLGRSPLVLPIIMEI